MAHGNVNITLHDTVDAQRIARALRDAGVSVQVFFTGSIIDTQGAQRVVQRAVVIGWGNTRRIEVRSAEHGVLAGHHNGRFNLLREEPGRS